MYHQFIEWVNSINNWSVWLTCTNIITTEQSMKNNWMLSIFFHLIKFQEMHIIHTLNQYKFSSKNLSNFFSISLFLVCSLLLLLLLLVQSSVQNFSIKMKNNKGLMKIYTQCSMREQKKKLVHHLRNIKMRLSVYVCRSPIEI